MLKRKPDLGIEIWRYFVCAVEQGSFLKAAALCKKDVSYISRKITELEHAMNEELLERSKIGVKPTWIGAQTFSRGKTTDFSGGCNFFRKFEKYFPSDSYRHSNLNYQAFSNLAGPIRAVRASDESDV